MIEVWGSIRIFPQKKKRVIKKLMINIPFDVLFTRSNLLWNFVNYTTNLLRINNLIIKLKELNKCWLWRSELLPATIYQSLKQEINVVVGEISIKKNITSNSLLCGL